MTAVMSIIMKMITRAIRILTAASNAMCQPMVGCIALIRR